MLNDFVKFSVQNPAVLAAIASTLSAITAIAAVIISPAITYFTVRKQIRANLVSANRQSWIDKLRDELSELFELLTWQYLQRPGTLSGEEGYRYEAEKRSRIRLLINRIRLRLNPQEGDSRTLVKNLQALQRFAAAGASSSTDFDGEMEAAVGKAQDILKAEWRRVKKGR
jgi:hypothetical protein